MEIVDSRYYDILGVPKSSSPDDLKRAYRKAAMINHPDKGGDPDKFEDLARAYEVLGDPKKRQIYDTYGEDALTARLVVLGGSGSGAQMQIRGRDVVHTLKVSLEMLYGGTTKKISVSRNVICSGCDGRGSQPGDPIRCLQCKGYGLYVNVRAYGFERREKTKHTCEECEGTGECVYRMIVCPQCKGDKVVLEKKILEVHVEKGMQNGQKVTFPGESDQAPKMVAGDIVVVLQEMEHPKFKRKNDDLFVEHTLSLGEALCGYQFLLTHLDGRLLLIKPQPGEVFLKSGSCKAIDDEGMPMYQRPFMKGKLYVHLNVEYPDSFSADQVQALEKIFFPNPRPQLTDMEIGLCEEMTLRDVDVEEELKRKQVQQLPLKRKQVQQQEADEVCKAGRVEALLARLDVGLNRPTQKGYRLWQGGPAHLTALEDAE